MTFKNVQDRVMERMRLTTATARARIKNRINERMRAAQTSVGLQKTRRGTVSVNTVSGTATIASTGMSHVFTVAIPLKNIVLIERTMDYLRLIDPSNTSSGQPIEYAVEKTGATTATLRLYPIPNAIYAVQLDGLLVGTDMSGDSDVPGIPEDFHDILIDGASADEYGDMEDQQAKVAECEERYRTRLRELRMFLAKSAWLPRQQGADSQNPAWLTNLPRWIA